MLWVSLIITITMLASGTAMGQSSDAITLLQREAVEDLQCRGGHGDDPITMEHCGTRDLLVTALKAAGYCFGKPGQVGYQMQWYKCRVAR
jgi:hypothetical protein